ncbi:hypothetical protein [Amycolatopsis plumensis]|uniref:Uncharacterized protein n=1 Tax=Amycolatopsis plumensis TaxID=236508 RepID=A0ABV5UFW0_9PSEU
MRTKAVKTSMMVGWSSEESRARRSSAEADLQPVGALLTANVAAPAT